MNKKVVVLMSTYNGEKYIDEQIESIINQDYEGQIILQIRDDGSNDATIEKIQRKMQSGNRRIELTIGENIGPQRSFLWLIDNAIDADFYFFADQDDVWNLRKISIAIDKMCDYRIPVCFCCNYSYFGLNNIKEVIKKRPIFHPLRIIFYNEIPGCTMGFNRCLMEILHTLNVTNVMMHDSYVLSVCAACGKIIYCNDSLIGHRIHNSNVVGATHKKIIPKMWIKEKLGLLINKESYDLSEIAKSVLKTGQVKERYKGDLILLSTYKENYIKTFKMLLHPDSFYIIGNRTTMSIRCKILFHVF